MKTLSKNKKQGPCGSFCFKFWLGAGCDDNCVFDDKVITQRLIMLNKVETKLIIK